MAFLAGQKLRASLLSVYLADDWNAITLQNSWANRGGYAVSSYRKIWDGAALEIVLNCTTGTVTSGTTVFNLPAGFRPTNAVQFQVTGRIASAPQQVSAIEVTSDGNAKCYDMGSSTTCHCSVVIPLDI